MFLARTNNLSKLDSILQFDKSNELYFYGKLRKEFLVNSQVDSSLLFSILDKKGQKAFNFRNHHLMNVTLGDYYLENMANDSLAVSIYRKSLDEAKFIKDSLIICESLKRIVSVLFKNGEQRFLLKKFCKEYQEYAYDLNENTQALYYSLGYKMISKERDNVSFEISNWEFEELIKMAQESNNKMLLAASEQLYGVKLWGFDQDYKKAIVHYEVAQKIYEDLNFGEAKIKLFGILVNMAAIHTKWDNPKKALSLLYEANKIKLPQRNSKDYVLFYDKLVKAHIFLKNIDSAIHYLNRKERAEKNANTFEQVKIISELETKYQTAEKEKQLLLQTQKTKTNRNWLIAATLALFLGSGIFVLLQKNTTKKRQLAEQEVLLKQQRVENLLKQQELLSIDAMIEGQEKERQKVAGELHDDLGSLMATIKLHFDNAKVSTRDPALKNAQKLLEEAYQKIRGMAHSKNSGVMSDQGLLPAIKKMAKSISESNALQVTVEDFGLGERMENSLELSIFRMVQELVANAIKHAEASKVSIQLTQHEDNLNIIVEDNGKGFDRSKLDNRQSGMGLTNIEKRVEHLEGNFTVDSVLGKGTSILIDIPV